MTKAVLKLTPFRADEVWHGLCVLRHIGRKTVAANARVGQVVRVASVVVQGGSLGWWLQADQL
jgi:hypothetical protein